MALDTQAIYEKTEEWAGPRRKEINEVLPFNPVLANSALTELLEKKEQLNWEQTAKLFEADPGLHTNFLRDANAIVKGKKRDREIRNLPDAISLLGNRTTIDILQDNLTNDIIEQFRKLPFKELEFVWQESWFLAEAARMLAPYFDVPEKKAYSHGLTANIGLLLLITLYREKYFLKIDGFLTDKVDLEPGERVYLEEQNFGVRHDHLGFWLLKNLGLRQDFCLGPLWHEIVSPSTASSPEGTLLAISNQIGKYLCAPAVLDYRYSQDIPEDIEDKFTLKRNQKRRAIRNYLENNYAVSRETTKRLLDKIDHRVKGIKETIHGKVEVLTQTDYLQALTEVQEKAEEAMREFLRRMESEYVENLPHPLAIRFATLAHRKIGALEFNMEMTYILGNLISILTSTLLAWCRYRLGPEKFRSVFIQGQNARKIKGSFYTDMGQGVGVARFFIQETMKLTPNISPPPLIGFYINNFDKFFSLCRVRGSGKSKDVAPLKYLERMQQLLIDFSKINANYLAITDNDYDEEKDKNIFFTINWEGTQALESRREARHLSQKGLGRGTVILRSQSPETPFLRLREFATYHKCTDCGKSHFYVAKQVSLDPRCKIRISLAPTSAGTECAPIPRMIVVK